MTGGLPAPLVPADVDLRDLDGFMLNVERLLASELWALTRRLPEAFRAAVGLWARAWKQLPAASLPADKEVIAAYADIAPAKLEKHWGLIMRGFVLCNDGRYYHRVLAEEALRAWEHKKKYIAKRDADRKRLDEWRKRQRETLPETRFETPTEQRRNSDVAEIQYATLRYATSATESPTDKPNPSLPARAGKFKKLGSGSSEERFQSQQARDEFAVSQCIQHLPGRDDGERWARALAAEDVSHPDHQAACLDMLAAAKKAGVGWVSPSRRKAKEPAA